MLTTSISRATVSRADLLRSLLQQKRDHLVLEDKAHTWMGYVLQAKVADMPSKGVQFHQDQDLTQIGPSTSRPTPQLQHLWAVTRHEVAPNEQTSSAQDLEVGEPMDEKTAQAKSKVSLAKHQDLLPWARLLPALLKPLRQPQQRGLDVPRWVEQWARRKRHAAWPRKIVQRLPGKLVVVLDFSEHLWPYRSDMHRLCRRFLSLCASHQLSLRVLLNGPQGGWTDWVAEQDLSRPAALQQWQAPSLDTPVLIVSDLGAHSSSASLRQSWSAFIAGLHKPVALCPIGKEQMDLPVFEQVRVLRWSPDAHMYFTQGRLTSAPNKTKGLADLLAMLACTRRVDPPLLRALRKLNLAQSRNAGLEAMAWNHPDVISSAVCTLRAESAQPHLRHFKERISPELKIRILHTRESQHRHFRAGLNHEENLLFYAYSDSVTKKQLRLKNWVEEAEQYASRILGSVHQGTARQFEQLARLWTKRADPTVVQTHSSLFKGLANTLRQLDQVRGGNALVPEWADPPQAEETPQNYWLVQDFASNTLHLQTTAAKARQSHVAGPIELSTFDIQIAPASERLPVSPKGESITLLDLNQSTKESIEIRSSELELRLQHVPRKPWLSSWGRNRQGLFALAPNPWGEAIAIDESLLLQDNIAPTTLFEQQSKTAHYQVGLDQIGLFAELNIKGQSQAFRYITPGQFLMGSPEQELDRREDEGPQHQVTLTEGLWLADTTCTQALWQVLMGNDPSRFKGETLPVEQVSWDEVQGFLSKLQAYLPNGIQAVLPTEAEWEYACRAGSASSFNFGENIGPEQVNYNGNYPYRKAPKGQYRRKTVPVKALPTNVWRLYQMHGNVWEWCADGMRDYTADAVTNPRGKSGKENKRFVVRGGCWISGAQYARSARRSQGVRDDRVSYLGFRFALRSTSQTGAGGQGLEGPRDEAVLQKPEAPVSKKGIFDTLFDKLKKPNQ